MGHRAKPFASALAAICWLAMGLTAGAPVAKAQFFWSPWFNDKPRSRPTRPPEPAPAPPPGNDLPAIEPQAELPPPPPPPDDRPYDDKLLRLAEILGALHYLRELCGADEGQLWREQMEELVKSEGTTAVRRARLVNAFNDGYRGFRRTYRNCNPSATTAIERFTDEGAKIALALANPSGSSDEGEAEDSAETDAAAETQDTAQSRE
ncbi:TIGR02301 family protein [Methyloligella solikamskensis]|uniref:TIGR02301 family protein n=1 Tax=Methyloligella solikamskensis TaxID=1177756 RepID=A0ABW3JEC8_9HYPH